MVDISILADVQDACISDLQKTARPSGPLCAIRTFLAQEAASTSELTARASKRRKLGNDGLVGPQSSDAFDEDRSVVLAKIAVVLHLPTSDIDESSDPAVHGNFCTPFEVSLESVTRREPHLSTISLHDPGAAATSIDIVASASPEDIDLIIPHLQTATSLRTNLNGKKRSRAPAAGFCRAMLRPFPEKPNALRLEVEICWLIGLSIVETLGYKNLGARDLKLLNRYFPDPFNGAKTHWSLADFYDSVHIPPTNLEVCPRIGESGIETRLYPFQQRAVDWLLKREGVTFSQGKLSALEPETSTPVSFRSTNDASGTPCFVSNLRGLVATDLSTVYDSAKSLRGGILAEEMGLGKTVELIALMCLHQRKIVDSDTFDNYLGASVKVSGSTLIITPPAILEQWLSEVKNHAPQLKVFHYTGLPAPSAPEAQHEAATVENLLQYDIVVTTYNVLSREVHFAKPPPDRAFRKEKKHRPRKSPLVQISWWRVCLDEAQMVENGVSQAATVARIIPRCNAWAVSGTPLRKDIQDLRGLLTFLRYEPFAGCKPVWERLDKPSFQRIFTQITLRHTKDKIRDELRLPPQKRIVITVPFTAIEEQNYSEMIRLMCDACGLSPEGIPLNDDQDVNSPEVAERMREWLVRLRQTCLHAHVGRRNRRALGAKNGPLRTVHEVLEVMIDQTDTSLKAEARVCILASLRRGHVIGNAKELEDRSKRALFRYETTLMDIEEYIELCRNDLQKEKEKLGLGVVQSKDTASVDSQDSEDEERGGENNGRVAAARKTLRTFLELEHACHFFIGTAHYQIKTNERLTIPDSSDFHEREKLEVESYEKAKVIRKELLRESKSRAQRQMKRIRSSEPFRQVSQIDDLANLGGIENVKMLEMLDNVCEILNAQAEQLEQWRQKIVRILLMPLVDEDEGKETTGEEYEDSTKVQDELYIYIMALRTLVADRHAAVDGLQDILVEHELKEAEKSARAKEGHAPELVLEIVKARGKLKPTEQTGSLKGVVSGMRSLITSLQWRADGGDQRARTELMIAQKHFSDVQRITNEQSKLLTELEKEQEMFRGAMNQRLEFYRQLQHISDTVAPFREELDEYLDRREHERQCWKMDETKKKVKGLSTRHAYLVNLRKENQQEDLDHECIICQDTFEIGVLTTCGHKYCKLCINQWWHEHRTCPLCKIRLYSSDFKDINFKPSSMKAQEEVQGMASPSQPSTPASLGSSIYSDISDSNMKEIKMIDLDGSYGTKVDMIARHLIWIRNNDPGAKSIIFSQFGDFLDVLGEALKRWKIGASSISDRDGIQKFKADPAMECFLLDAKSDSSGLNLVNATYVFLCEPLINPAIELQAIARVHRIGQQRPTTVFMYLVTDTVEEAIYDISVARRLEHMGTAKKQEAGARSGTTTPALQESKLDAANSMEMEATPLKQLLRKKGDGEVVQRDDVWSCLFGKARKQPKAVLEREVGRHVRAEAAERRLAEQHDLAMRGAAGPA
ncbi:ATP-dependent DNA helicase [Polyplosphaeria fusca]|uniref:ATP-dependent DNA helicase n=1 Tax=Polyplosphaeria fusca TaxID=682080 RepID=A0A9P4RBM1_9PLEO|nr:ATP-dependent DNA helicase [Polyplosphaeria fusca]